MTQDNSKHQMWTPPALRRPVLLTFACLFAAVAISLGVVLKHSNEHHGIATPQNRLRYLWTYVPSTFFIIISGFWASVCHNSKTLAPWHTLLKGPTTSSKSVLLDYTSGNQFNSLFRSLKNAHYHVSLAIIGSLFLDLLIILSTGLFRVREFSEYVTNYSFLLASKLNQSVQVDYLGSSVATVFAVSQYGLEYPPGSTKDFAYTNIDATMVPLNATADLTVDAVHIGTSCEVANSTWTFGLFYDPRRSPNVTAGHKIEAETSKCHSVSVSPFVTTALKDTYFFEMNWAYCPKPDNPEEFTTQLRITANTMTVTDMNITAAYWASRNITWMNYPDKANHSRMFLPVENKTISTKAATIMCTIAPYLRNASVTINKNSANATLLDPVDTKKLDILGQNDRWTSSLQWQLQDAALGGTIIQGLFLAGLDDWTGAKRTLRLPKSPSDMGLDTWGGNMTVLFQLMNNTDPRRTVRDMVDAEYLAKSAEKTLQTIATQYVADYMFPRTSKNYTGSLSYTKERIVASKQAVGVIIAFLTLLVIVCLALCALPQIKMVKDPGSIASKATILARSPDVIDFARRNLCGRSDNQIERHLGAFKAGITWEDGREIFSIELVDHDAVHDDKDPKPKKAKKEWWQPWATSPSCKVLAILVICIGIALLQGLLYKSDRNQGIANVSFNTYAQYAWVYIPVLVIFLMNTIFSGISFINRVIQPYVAISQRPTPATRSLSVDLVNRVSLTALWFSIKLKHIGTAASILATLLGATLPIAASGLYRVQHVVHSNVVSFRQTTSFDPTLSLTTKIAGFDVLPVPGLILYQNLSYPRWTYGKYALSEIAVDNHTTTENRIDTSTTSSLSIELPAVYGVANCSPIPDEAVKMSGRSSNKTGIDYYIDLYVNLGPECRPLEDSIPVYPNSFQENQGYIFDSTKPNDFLFGFWVGSFLGVVNASDPSLLAATYHGRDDGRPKHCTRSVAQFIKGTYYPNNTESESVKIEQQIFLSCTPYVNREILDVKFSLPDFDISPLEPPVPKPGTSTFFSEAELVNNEAWVYYLPSRGDVAVLDPKVTGVIANEFFEAVFGGDGGILPSAFLGPKDVATKKLQDRIDEVYGIIVAQVYGGKRRFPTLAQEGNLRFDGTVSTPAQQRVKQDKVSTRIIQGILAAMLICAVVSMCLVHGRRVLKHNPCSIAGVAALFVHSSVLNKEVIPLGSEFHNDQELRQMGALEHGLFSLGWWTSGHSRWYGIDMGRAEKDRDSVIHETVFVPKEDNKG